MMIKTRFGIFKPSQALCAAGRGIAVVSDDPRYDLERATVGTADGELRVRLHCAWDPRHPAAEVLAALAARIGDFVVDRYPS